MGHEARWEYYRVIYERYRKAEGKAKRVMLDEFCLNTGYHRKYAIRLLHGPSPGKRGEARARGRKPRYGQQVVSLLAAIWEVAGYPWSVRLKALLPSWMPWIRQRYKLSAETEKQLLGISARQIDRRLQAKKNQCKRRSYGRTKPGTLLKHHIPVKTDSWDVTTPGFAEIDLVSHSGNSGEGEFAHTLNLTDIHSGWTESRALLGKSQVGVQQALQEIQGGLPFRLLGLDSDNGSEFINWHLQRWCKQSQIQLTRGRPYKKDDNAHIEQKNWTHVRKLLGWERYDSRAAVEAINDLYRHELRLWLNLYLPSVKLVKKVRVGSKVRRVYDAAQTPFERVLASSSAPPDQVTALQKLRSSLDPFQLAQVIERKIECIYEMANRRLSPPATQDTRNLPVAQVQPSPRPGGGKDARGASLEIASRFPLSHRLDGEVPVTFSMSRRGQPKLHS
ncbi:MAG TPA: integrase [Terriglobia bacterium]|nr:integrase [Terriglobia bacterium]